MLIKQDSEYRTQFWAESENEGGKGKLEEVDLIHQLNPYSMMLSSLASCTAIVLHTYAQYHHLALEEVEMRMQYSRNHKKDCETCEEQDEYSEEIQEDIMLKGKLSDQEREKLLRIAHACPIYKMFKDGIPIHTQLVS